MVLQVFLCLSLPVSRALRQADRKAGLTGSSHRGQPIYHVYHTLQSLLVRFPAWLFQYHLKISGRNVSPTLNTKTFFRIVQWALKDRCFGGTTAETFVKFQSDAIIWGVAMILCVILRFITQNNGVGAPCEIVLMWMSQYLRGQRWFRWWLVRQHAITWNDMAQIYFAIWHH